MDKTVAWLSVYIESQENMNDLGRLPVAQLDSSSLLSTSANCPITLDNLSSLSYAGINQPPHFQIGRAVHHFWSQMCRCGTEMSGLRYTAECAESDFVPGNAFP